MINESRRHGEAVPCCCICEYLRRGNFRKGVREEVGITGILKSETGDWIALMVLMQILPNFSVKIEMAQLPNLALFATINTLLIVLSDVSKQPQQEPQQQDIPLSIEDKLRGWRVQFLSSKKLFPLCVKVAASSKLICREPYSWPRSLARQFAFCSAISKFTGQF